VPYKIIGGVRFYERREVKDMLAYLRLVHNPYDSVSLKRVINVPARGIGAGTWQKIEQQGDQAKLSVWDVIGDLSGVEGVRPSTRKAVHSFATLIAYLRGKRDEYSVTKILEEIIENTGYVRELEKERTPEGVARAENIRELLTVTQQFEATSEDKSLHAFLEQTALIADIDSLEEGTPAVTLMTLHSAKGLEFPVVFLVGMEEGVFPHARAMQSDKEMEEERRLAYVGITRAKDELFLSFAARRTIFGNTQINQVSRFIREIPDELFRSLGSTRKPGVLGAGARVLGRWSRDEYSQVEDTWENAQRGTRAAARVKPPSANPDAGYKIGQKVKHAVFGQGVVIGSVGDGEDAQITVAFPKVGVKKLVAGFARLEKV
jgi:DNA helicase-2/ATP-dependent DNA helicase PcrA